MGYPSLVLPETLSLYWPLFLLVIFQGRKSVNELTAIFVLSAIGCFSYEAAALLFAVNFLLLLFQERKVDGEKGQKNILLITQFFTTVFLGARVFLASREDSQEFMAAILGAFWEGDFKKFAFSFLLALFFIAFLSMRSEKLDALAQKIGLVFSIFAGNFFFYWMIFSQHSYSNPFDTMWWERIVMVPISAGIALLMGALVIWRPLWVKDSRSYSAAILIVCVALFISLARDLRVTTIWRGGYKAVMELRRDSEGCNILPKELALKLFREPFFITEYWLPSLSLAPELSLSPSTIFYVEENPTGESCYQRGDIFGKDSGRFRGETARFDLSRIKTRKIFLYHWNAEMARLEKTEIPRR